MLSNHRTRISFALAFSVAAFGILVSTACASEPRPRPTQLDPSNPAAPESPRVALAVLTAPPGEPMAPTSSSGEKTDHRGNPEVKKGDTKGDAKGDAKSEAKPPGPSAVVYTCPMDPEVISDKPGKCQKCGMKLVPKEPTQGKK